MTVSYKCSVVEMHLRDASGLNTMLHEHGEAIAVPEVLLSQFLRRPNSMGAKAEQRTF